MIDDGALLFCDRPANAVVSAFEATVIGLGYARADGPSDLEVDVTTDPSGTCLRIGSSKGLALAFARMLAVRLSRNVRVLTASVVVRGEGFDCVLDDLLVAVDGTMRQGTWASDTTSLYGDDWSQVCDGKAYVAVRALLEGAVETLLSEPRPEPSFHLSSPPSLGTVRLDEIAKHVRLAERAQLTTVAGRRCVRITNAGTTVTSFVEPHEAETLQKALGARLTTP